MFSQCCLLVSVTAALLMGACIQTVPTSFAEPQVTGSFTFTLHVTDGGLGSAERSFTIQVH